MQAIYHRELFDHLIGPEQHGLGNREAQRPGGLEIDDELELGCLLDRKILRIGAAKDLVFRTT